MCQRKDEQVSFPRGSHSRQNQRKNVAGLPERHAGLAGPKPDLLTGRALSILHISDPG